MVVVGDIPHAAEIGDPAVQRRLATIIAARVVKYGRLMGLDEAGTHAAWKAHRQELIDAKISEYQAASSSIQAMAFWRISRAS
jgi:hypothetical protein